MQGWPSLIPGKMPVQGYGNSGPPLPAYGPSLGTNSLHKDRVASWNHWDTQVSAWCLVQESLWSSCACWKSGFYWSAFPNLEQGSDLREQGSQNAAVGVSGGCELCLCHEIKVAGKANGTERSDDSAPTGARGDFPALVMNLQHTKLVIWKCHHFPPLNPTCELVLWASTSLNSSFFQPHSHERTGICLEQGEAIQPIFILFWHSRVRQEKRDVQFSYSSDEIAETAGP